MLLLLSIIFGINADREILKAQSYDPEDGHAPATRHFLDGDGWRPLNPKPFKGCQLIINQNPKNERLTIEVILKNRGFKSDLKISDSTVDVFIDCVAEDVVAARRASAMLPMAFDLRVYLTDMQVAQYRVEFDDSLSIRSIAENPEIELVDVKRVSEQIHWIQFTKTIKPSLIPAIQREFDKSARLLILDEGYYWGFPARVMVDKSRRIKYNKTAFGTIVFLSSRGESFRAQYYQLLRKLAENGDDILAQGSLVPGGAAKSYSER